MLFNPDWVLDLLAKTSAVISNDAEGVEVVFQGEEAHYMRLAESAITQTSKITRGQVTIRAIHGGAESRVSTEDLSSEGLRIAAQSALKRAKESPPGSEPAQLPDGGPSICTTVVNDETVALDGPTKSEWLQPALHAHQTDGLALAGRFHSGLSTLAVMSSMGVESYHQGSWSDLSLSALERPAGHRASSFRAYFDSQIDLPTLSTMQEVVRQECHRARNPVTVDPGEWDVVLAPAAVGELLGWLGDIAFTSRAMEDGLSFVSGNEGKQVTGQAITILDDSSMPYEVGVPLPFDTEGQQKQRVVLLEEGVAKGIVHNARSARRFGCQGTGHAQPTGEFTGPGSKASHLHIQPGTATVDELVGQVDRGLFITRLHYVNGMIEPRRAVMTGLLRDAAFLIEDGRLSQAVTPIRFTDSILEAFSRVPGKGGISRNVEACASWFGPQVCTVAPYLLIPKLRFTSGR
jgi:PmbA protein